MKSDNNWTEFIKKAITPKAVLIIGLGILILLFTGLPTEEEAVSAGYELEELCSAIGGVGRCRVMTATDSDGEISAVAVLCDGAESVEVQERLFRMISSLYGIGYNRISILKISQ